MKIPNDFLFQTCKCNEAKPSSNVEQDTESSLNGWNLCKCDLDTQSVESFLIKIGLPMYIEKVDRNSQPFAKQFQQVFDMSLNDLESCFCIQNRQHLRVIFYAIQLAKQFVL